MLILKFTTQEVIEQKHVEMAPGVLLEFYLMKTKIKNYYEFTLMQEF